MAFLFKDVVESVKILKIWPESDKCGELVAEGITYLTGGKINSDLACSFGAIRTFTPEMGFA